MDRRSWGNFRKRLTTARPPGSAPGKLVANPDANATVVTVTAFGPDQLIEEQTEDLRRISELREQHPVVWVDIVGLGNADVFKELGSVFGIGELTLEDMLNVPQRPKADYFENSLFLVLRIPQASPRFHAEQLSLFIGEGFVVSCREQVGDCFDLVRARLREARPIRRRSADYLAYALIDAVVDSYYPILEIYGEALDAAEHRVFYSHQEKLMRDIHIIKRDLLLLRRTIWPQREVLHSIIRDQPEPFKEHTILHLRDCYDHVVQAMEMTETFREAMSDLVDIHLSLQGHQVNEIMKVLTIIATIFIPLTTITGLYGMNFDPQASPWNMPELDWRYGYFYALGLMATTAGGMLYYFKRKGWLWSRRR